MAFSLYDDKTGKVYDAPDEETAQKQIQAYGLTQATPEQVQNYDAQKRSGGLGAEVQTVGESAAGAVAETMSGVNKALVDPRYELDQKAAYVRPEQFAPFAFTPEAKERRQVNPKSALLGAAIPDLAATALVPEVEGAGMLGQAGSMLGRSLVSGGLTEGGQAMLENRDYDMHETMQNALAASLFEGTGRLAFHGAMKALGLGGDVLDETVARARNAAIADAVSESDPALKGAKMAANAGDLYEKHQGTLDDALGTIDERMAEAPEKLFTPSALKKSVSSNATAQSEQYLNLAAQVDHAAQVSGMPEVAEVTKILEEHLESTGANMFGALREAKAALENITTESPLARNALGALDDSLRDESLWGRAAKNYADVADQAARVGGAVAEAADAVGAGENAAHGMHWKQTAPAESVDEYLGRVKKSRAEAPAAAEAAAETASGKVKAGERAVEPTETAKSRFEVHDLDQREALEARLDAAERMATATGDKKLAKAVKAARESLSGADAVTGARLMRGGVAAEAAADAAQPGARVKDRQRAEQGIPGAARPPPKGLVGRAKRWANDIAEYEIDNVVQSGLTGGGAAIGHVVGGPLGGVAGYLLGRHLHIRYGDELSHLAWTGAKKVIRREARENLGRTVATVAGGAAGTLAGGPILGAVAGAAANKAAKAAGKYVAQAGEAAGEVATEAKGLGRRVWNAAKARVKENPVQAAGTAALLGASAFMGNQDGVDKDGKAVAYAPAAAALLGFFLPHGMGRRAALDALEHEAEVLARHVPVTEKHAITRAINQTQHEIRNVLYNAAHDAEGHVNWTGEQVVHAQADAVREYLKNEGYELSSNAKSYLDAKLKSYNAKDAATSPALSRMHEAHEANVIRERPSVPPDQRLRELGSIQTNAQLDERASAAFQALGRHREAMLSRIMDRSDASEDIRTLASDYLQGHDSLHFASTADIVDQQLEIVRAQWLRAGGDMRGEGREGALRRLPEDVEEAARREIARINASEATMHASAAPEVAEAASPQAARVRRVEELLPVGGHRDLADQSNEALFALGSERNYRLTRIMDDHEDALRRRAVDYINGETYSGGEALLDHQMELVQDQWSRAGGDMVEATGHEPQLPPDVDRAARAELTRLNANQASLENVPAEAARSAEEPALKPSNEAATPAVIDGVSAQAADRLDAGLGTHLDDMAERVGAAEDERGAQAFAHEHWPEIERAAQQVARENPSLMSEEQAVGYARRRWEGVRSGDEVEEARQSVSDDRLMHMMRSEVRDLAAARQPLRFSAIRDGLEESLDLNAADRERILELYEDRQEQLYDHYYEHEAPSSSEREPDSEPTSDYASGKSRGPGINDGLPPDSALSRAGLTNVVMHDRDGIEETFGRELSTHDLRGMLGLDHFKEYAEENGHRLQTMLKIDRDGVTFKGRAGDFEMDTTYHQTGDGLEIYHGLLIIPNDLQATGKAKELIRGMVDTIEDLGATEVSLNAAWVGKYAWPALGARPSEIAENQAIGRFRQHLASMTWSEDFAKKVTDEIKNIRDLADATIPLSRVEHALPKIKEQFANVVRGDSTHIKKMDFDKAFIRLSKTDPENHQFRAGKLFLLAEAGDWNNNLSLKIAPGDPWYEQFKYRLGLGATAVALGLSMPDILAAFSESKLTLPGVGGGTASVDPAVIAHQQEQQERAQVAHETKQKLAYLQAQSKTQLVTTARAIANPAPNERTVPRVAGVTNSVGVGTFLGNQETLRGAYDEKKTMLQKLQQDPMTLVNHMGESLASLDEAAPGLHRQVVAQTYKVAQFLQGKLPGTIGASLARPDGSPPSPLAVRQFALYYSAATDPSSVLTDLTHNRARREQVDTLRELWPDTYSNLKQAVVEQMANGRPTVAQRSRMDLLFDFGDSLDKGLSPRLVDMLSQYRAQNDKGQAGGGGGSGGPAKAAPGRRTQPSIAGASPLAGLGFGVGPNPAGTPARSTPSAA